jgi:hypothetical protein
LGESLAKSNHIMEDKDLTVGEGTSSYADCRDAKVFIDKLGKVRGDALKDDGKTTSPLKSLCRRKELPCRLKIFPLSLKPPKF